MKKFLSSFVLTMAFVLTAHFGFSPPPPKDSGRTDPAGGAPIDGLVSLLALGGAAVAFYKLRKASNA